MQRWLILQDHGVGIYEDGRAAWSQVGQTIEAETAGEAIQVFVDAAPEDEFEKGPARLAAIWENDLIVADIDVRFERHVTYGPTYHNRGAR